MLKGIAGYTATKQQDGVLLVRSYAGVDDSVLAKDFNEAARFITADYPNTLHVTWSLAEFTDALFTLIPADVIQKLKDKPRAYYGGCKLYYTPIQLGITATQPIEGNFVAKVETNIYQLQHWAPSEYDTPTDAKGVALLGEAILDGLEALGIVPDNFTSPVGVYMRQLDPAKFPTLYSFREDWLGAMEYAVDMMRREWRSAYQVGYWPAAYPYDQNGAYPSIMADLPDTSLCYCWHSSKYEKCSWGVVKGIVEVTAPVSPLVYDSGDGFINPAGVWHDVFTTEEINWLVKHKAGKFTLEDGWFFRWFGADRPYRDVVLGLYGQRQGDNAMAGHLARRISQGLSGKLDQDNKDGTTGDFYNPVLAAITRSRCRLRVADFIYTNNVIDNLIAIQVDGALLDAPVGIDGNGGLGAWRFDGATPALVLGKGSIWQPGKKPQGLTFDQVTGAFKDNPARSFYQFGGKYIDFKAGELDIDRVYINYPKTGGDAMAKASRSTPLVVGKA